MKNPKMLSRLLVTALVSLASVAAVSAQAADPVTSGAPTEAASGAIGNPSAAGAAGTNTGATGTNTGATGANTGATGANTGATGTNTGATGAIPATGAPAGAAEAATGAATDTAAATAAPADDATITTMVKTALAEDKKMKSLKISISTEQGVVKMSGTVPNAKVGTRAQELVAGVQGVKDVKNEMKVKAKG